MRLNFVSLVVAATALVLTACNADVDIEPGADSTAAMMDTTTMPPPAMTDTTALVDTTTTTTTTTTTETTSGTTDATTGATTTPSTSTSTTTTTTPSTTPATTPSASTPPKTTTTTTPPAPPASTPPPATPPPTTPTPPTGGADAKASFLAQKCNTCHNVPSASISKTMASSKAPDLTGGRSTATIAAYLKGTESINGKKHVKKWTGSDADLQAVSAWLAGL